MHKKPAMLIGMFINIHKIVLEFDPLTDLVVAHDAFYDALMTDLFMNSLGACNLILIFSEFCKWMKIS